MHIDIEIHNTRPWDNLPTYWRGVLAYGTLLGTMGLPVVRLTSGFRDDDGIVAGEIRPPTACLPLTLVRPVTREERHLLIEALAQGYQLDPRSEFH